MSLTTPYVYCPKNVSPDGPVGSGPRQSSCGTVESVVSGWPAVRKWKLDIIDAEFRLDAYVYNATQRGTYYYQYNGSGTMTTAPITDICATGNSSRTFSGAGLVTASYKYIPCGQAPADCGGGPGSFCNSREAMDTLSMTATMNSWVVSSAAGSTNSSPIVYWNVPTANLTGYESNSTGGLPFTPCFEIPWGASSGYGCNNQGYDCFGGPGGPSGTPSKQEKGYWQLNGEVWTYSADWYWENTTPLNPYTCGKCTFCAPVCDCERCGTGKSCGENNDQCAYASCGDHDLWQKGVVRLSITPGSLDPARCTD